MIVSYTASYNFRHTIVPYIESWPRLAGNEKSVIQVKVRDCGKERTKVSMMITSINGSVSVSLGE